MGLSTNAYFVARSGAATEVVVGASEFGKQFPQTRNNPGESSIKSKKGTSMARERQRTRTLRNTYATQPNQTSRKHQPSAMMASTLAFQLLHHKTLSEDWPPISICRSGCGPSVPVHFYMWTANVYDFDTFVFSSIGNFFRLCGMAVRVCWCPQSITFVHFEHACTHQQIGSSQKCAFVQMAWYFVMTKGEHYCNWRKRCRYPIQKSRHNW